MVQEKISLQRGWDWDLWEAEMEMGKPIRMAMSRVGPSHSIRTVLPSSPKGRITLRLRWLQVRLGVIHP